MLERMERIEEPKSEAHVKPIILKTVSHLPEKIMELKQVTVGYDSPIVSIPYDVIVTKRDKIGIIGRNGAGKTTFLKTILGEIKPLSGDVIKNPSLTIGSYSQVLADLDRDATIMEELTR